MDEMKIASKFGTYLVSKVIRKAIKKQVGYDVDIRLNDFRAYLADEKMQIHLDIDAELNPDEFKKIVNDTVFKD